LNFGQLHIATLWRLRKDGVERRATVLDSARGPRLVILEPDRIVQWETFRMARPLRQRAVAIRRELCAAGWEHQPDQLRRPADGSAIAIPFSTEF
jgi:hypothetical protein